MKNLAEKALLVTLNISQWSARKYDRKVTEEVNDTHQAKDAGRFNKLLIDKTHLDEIQKIVNEARHFHYENTLPWSDLGDRLLPSKNYFEYIQKLSRYKTSFEACVDTFCKKYDSMINEAQGRLNSLFDSRDYPADISGRFGFKTVFMPIPETAGFRVDLDTTEIDKLKSDIETEVQDRFTNATQELYSRIKTQLEKMHERLKDADNKFRDTLFTNLADLIDLLPRLNVSNDRMIEALCSDMKGLLVNPDSVRADELLRKRKADEVNAILNNLNGFLNPASVSKNPVEVFS